ncbi:MAG TPA: hypothetical protein VFS30_05285 [Dehalococcoidia bacterium]|nr:hypothetical protein [Dehalococcoidia bacterium]
MNWLGAALAALALIGGGLFFGGSLVSAQEPTPEVTQEAEPATPESTVEPDATEQAAPDEQEDSERSKEECDDQKDGADATGISFRGGPRSLAQ